MITGPYSVYVRLGEGDRIEAIDSDAFLTVPTSWTKIDEGYGDRFHHAQAHYIPGDPKDERGVCLYKLVDNQIAPRTQEEMDADWAVIEDEVTEHLYITTNNGDIAFLTTPDDMSEDPLDRVLLYLQTDNGDIAYATTQVEMERNPLTATAKQDVRLGKTAVTSEGVVTGEKNFPSYETTASKVVIYPEMEFKVRLEDKDTYDFTRLQAIFCAFNTTPDDSVNAEKVCIDDTVYAVGSTVTLATVNKDAETKTINFGITNTGDTPVVVRYFTYKEVT